MLMTLSPMGKKNKMDNTTRKKVMMEMVPKITNLIVMSKTSTISRLFLMVEKTNNDIY
jgi:hypothetical protein